ncbi:hypothetical protein KCP76_20820 [Salmonella enterica subsp. enterica serovar Weltevreden]|nr:hypothetical protein KCP76_20820 [Salmonella enterica subsp. enterica serovar Weltevreden]
MCRKHHVDLVICGNHIRISFPRASCRQKVSSAPAGRCVVGTRWRATPVAARDISGQQERCHVVLLLTLRGYAA